MVNEAALLAAKQGVDHITSPMIDYAYDKVLMGVGSTSERCARLKRSSGLLTTMVDMRL